MAERNGNGQTTDGRIRKLENNAVVFDEKLDVLTGKVDKIASVLDASLRAKQFSWSSVSAFMPTIAAIAAFVLFLAAQYINGLIGPLKADYGALEERVRANRDDINRNTNTISEFRAVQVAHIQEAKAKEVEQETQFKYVGIIRNMDKVDAMTAHCRMDESECSDAEYFPSFERAVTTNGHVNDK